MQAWLFKGSTADSAKKRRMPNGAERGQGLDIAPLWHKLAEHLDRGELVDKPVTAACPLDILPSPPPSSLSICLLRQTVRIV